MNSDRDFRTGSPRAVDAQSGSSCWEDFNICRIKQSGAVFILFVSGVNRTRSVVMDGSGHCAERRWRVRMSSDTSEFQVEVREAKRRKAHHVTGPVVPGCVEVYGRWWRNTRTQNIYRTCTCTPAEVDASSATFSLIALILSALSVTWWNTQVLTSCLTLVLWRSSPHQKSCAVDILGFSVFPHNLPQTSLQLTPHRQRACENATDLQIIIRSHNPVSERDVSVCLSVKWIKTEAPI